MLSCSCFVVHTEIWVTFLGMTVHGINELLIGGMVPWVIVISTTLKNK